EHGTLVVAVATPRRYSDGLASLGHFVVRQRRVYSGRKIDVLRGLFFVEQRPEGLLCIVGIPNKRDFFAMRTRSNLFKSGSTDEIVVELDDGTVAEIVRREVILRDVAGVKAAAERRSGLITITRQPLPVWLQRFARINGRHRRRNPPGFQRVARIGTGPDLPQSEFFSGLQNCFQNLFALCPRTEQFPSWLSDHTVTESAHVYTGNGNMFHVEKFDIGRRLTQELNHDLRRIGALKLISVPLPDWGALANN